MKPSRRSFGGATMLAASIAMSLALMWPAGVAAASSPIRFHVSIGLKGACIIVLTDANTSTDVRLRSADGTTKASDTLPSDEIFWCLPNGVSADIGDRIRASDGSFTRTFVVPEITVAVDREADLVYGTGPAQRTLVVGWGGRFGDVFQDRGVRVDADGTWSLDPNFDIPGGQEFAVNWKTPNGDRVSTRGTAAALIVTLGSARFVGGSGEPFANVEVNIDGTHDGGWSGQSDVFGEFSGRFRRPNGNLIPVQAGDRISAPSVASDLDWIVPDLEISADAATEMVTGQCAGTTAVVTLHRTGSQRGFALMRPGSSDEFEFDFSDPMASEYAEGIGANEANVKHGDSLRMECILETGDSVLLRVIVP
jgi:hypothetical protein